MLAGAADSHAAKPSRKTATAGVAWSPAVESIGGVRLGMTRGEVMAVLGRPSSRHGLQWSWRRLNIVVGFTAATRTSAPVVEGIVVHGTSSLKTSRAIGIGSKVADVDAAYSASYRRSSGCPKEYRCVGGDQGLMFDIGTDGVDAVYFGADLGP